jgi:ABC-2 type transport system ATP-binding protein
MARRVGLAQALINDPDLVILDEPTSGLDPLGTRQVKDLILTLAGRGKSILLSSHLLADVEDVCDRVVILYNGRVQAAGPMKDLLEEQNRFRLTLPEVEPAVLQSVLKMLREQLGRDPDVDHPRRDLEQFFVEVVEKARAETAEASGVGRGEQVADYLQAEREPRSLDDLVVRDEEEEAAGEAAAPEPVTPPPPRDEEKKKAADEKLSRFSGPGE